MKFAQAMLSKLQLLEYFRSEELILLNEKVYEYDFISSETPLKKPNIVLMKSKLYQQAAQLYKRCLSAEKRNETLFGVLSDFMSVCTIEPVPYEPEEISKTHLPESESTAELKV